MNDRAGLAPTDKGTSDLACTLDDTCPGLLSHSFVSGLQRLQEEVEKHHEINNDQETHLTELLGHIRMLDAPNSQFRTSTTEDKRERLEGYRTNLKDCRFEASKSETFLSSRHTKRRTRWQRKPPRVTTFDRNIVRGPPPDFRTWFSSRLRSLKWSLL